MSLALSLESRMMTESSGERDHVMMANHHIRHFSKLDRRDDFFDDKIEHRHKSPQSTTRTYGEVDGTQTNDLAKPELRYSGPA